jgi:galactokinase
MNSSLLTQLTEAFKNHFQTTALLAFAPGRINIIGEHTDYNEGFVFPAAINLGVALAIQTSGSAECRIIANDMKEALVFSLDEPLAPMETPGWQNYVIGILLELQKKGLKPQGFNAVFGGDIPIGSGLSSSAALENVFLVALNQLFDFNLDKMDTVLMAQQAEHNAVGVKCGIMDQYSSMFGEEGTALFLDCQSIASQKIPIALKDYELLLINSNVEHSLAENAYNERRASCERVAAHLGVASLRHVVLKDLKAIEQEIRPEDFEKALYVLQENQRVLLSVEALKQNDLEQLGATLFQSHEGMRHQYQITCEELDFLVEEALRSNLVIGSRMMGGGFGGCTINLIKKGEALKFFEQVRKAYFNKFNMECTAIPVRIGPGARLIETI